MLDSTARRTSPARTEGKAAGDKTAHIHISRHQGIHLAFPERLRRRPHCMCPIYGLGIGTRDILAQDEASVILEQLLWRRIIHVLPEHLIQIPVNNPVIQTGRQGEIILVGIVADGRLTVNRAVILLGRAGKYLRERKIRAGGENFQDVQIAADTELGGKVALLDIPVEEERDCLYR